MTEPGHSRWWAPVDVARGFLIGSAELVPGVSGGTVALVTGVYDRLVDAAVHAGGTVRRAVTGPDRVEAARAESRRTDWWLLTPLLAGMLLAVATVAGVMERFVADHPELARGLFGGIVLVSISVPLRMLPPRGDDGGRVRDVVTMAVGAAAGFTLVALAGGGSIDSPPWWMVAGAAAVAVCALVMPGVSGSFILLAMGLYSPTLAALSSRDLGYLALFAAGAVVGLSTFVRLLRFLLASYRRPTLLVMAGLMLGSLRALWPWQSGEGSAPGDLVAPYDPVLAPVLLALLGGAVVLVLMALEARWGSSDS